MERREDRHHPSDSDKSDSLTCSSDDHSYSSYEITRSSQCSGSKSSSCDTVSSNNSCTDCESSSSSKSSSCDTSCPPCSNSVSTCTSTFSSCEKSSNSCDLSTSSCVTCSDSSGSCISCSCSSCSESCEKCSRSCSESCEKCSESCDVSCSASRDNSCYDPKIGSVCCPEDCGPVKCKEFNIYWFGSSMTDMGNGRCNLGLEPYTVVEKPGPCQQPLFGGYGPCARRSDVKVYPQFIAEDLGLETHLEYDLCELPRCKNNLVSFSLGGATQCDNITPRVPADLFGYDYQIHRYLDLYDESTCYAIPENDIFFYTEVGATTLLKLLELIEQGVIQVDPVAIINYLETFLVDKALKNIKVLYNEGKARMMFVQLIDVQSIMLTPLYQKVACLPEIIFELYDQAIHQLRDALNDFAQNVPNFDLVVILSHDLYDEILTNPGAFGAIPGPTMMDLGWPEKVFSNQVFFDDFHTTSHSNRVIANFVKTWFQQKVCY